MAETTAMVETIQELYGAFGRGDVPAILDMLSDDVGWDLDAPGYGIPIYEPGEGKDHVQRFFGEVAKFEVLRFEPTNFLAGGNQVAVPIQIEVRVPETGEVVSALEIHLWTFGEDGKISRLFHCVDRHAFVLAYGT